MRRFCSAVVLLFIIILTVSQSSALMSDEADFATVILDESAFLAMDSGGSYILGADITVNETYGIHSLSEFHGTLDGNGKAVNLVGVPLFYKLSGTLKNIKLAGSIGSSASPHAGDAGGAATYVLAGAQLYGIESNVSVHATGSAGGIAGRAEGTSETIVFSGCTNIGEIRVSGANAGGAAGILGFSSGASVKAENCTNSGKIGGLYAGGIIGGSELFSSVFTINGCGNEGIITASKYAGGVAGVITGQLRASGNSSGKKTGAEVSAEGAAGGIFGYVSFYAFFSGDGFYSNIDNCTNHSVVSSAKGQAGGIVGIMSSSAFLSKCVNAGYINAGTYGGGIVGESNGGEGEIVLCENRSAVMSNSIAGGIAGLINTASDKVIDFSVSHCYNFGAVTSKNTIAGGMAGRIASSSGGGAITIAYSGNCGSVKGNSYAGGIAGNAASTNSGRIAIENCFIAGGDISAKYAAGILAYCDNESLTLRGCYAAGGILTASGGSTYAILAMKTGTSGVVWKSTDINFAKAGYADYMYADKNGAYGFDADCLFVGEDLITGRAAVMMNTKLGSEVYRQDLHCEDFDAYPTTAPGRHAVYYAGTTADGTADVFANGRIAIELLSGAAVRLSRDGGLRFSSYMTTEAYNTCHEISDNPNNVEIGTIIVPTDYLRERGVTKFAFSSLHAAGITEFNFDDPASNTNPSGLYYINIRAVKGFEFHEDGSIYINASLIDLKFSSYRRAFSAVSYISFVVDGTRYYKFSEYSETENSRTIEKVAYSALSDIVYSDQKTQGYIYPLDGGGWSCYSPAQRDVLKSFITVYEIRQAAGSGCSIIVLSDRSEAGKYGSMLSFIVDYTGSGKYTVLINGEPAEADSEGVFNVRIYGDITISAFAS